MAAQPACRARFLCVVLAALLAAPLADCKLTFGALSDWGGQSLAPFTTVGQLAAAEGLTRVAALEKPSLMLSAGGNFLSDGLPAGYDSPLTQARFAATFEAVYTGVDAPFYVTAGEPDWLGNVTAEMAFNGTDASRGRWLYPNLWCGAQPLGCRRSPVAHRHPPPFPGTPSPSPCLPTSARRYSSSWWTRCC